MRSIRRVPIPAAMLLALASSAFATPLPSLPLDEYLCYQAKESKTPTQGKFKDLQIQVQTKDQFDVVRVNNVTKFVNICNPVLAGNSCSGPVEPSIHLTEYAIKDAKVSAKFSAPSTVYNLADCVGMPSGVTISKPKSLMVRTSKIDYGPVVKCKVNGDCTVPAPGDICTSGRCLPPGLPVPGAPGMVPNTADYMCYSIKGPKGPFGVVGPVIDQFNHPEAYLLNKITKVCAPTEKAVYPGPAPDGDSFAGHLICYQAKSQKLNSKFVAHQVSTNNMLAPFQLDATKVTDYCMPALKAISPAMPGMTPTALLTTSLDAGGVCGSLTTNMAAPEGVPGRRNPDAALTNPNACCTGAGAGTCNSVCVGAFDPIRCCTGPGTGTCNTCCEGSTVGHCNEDTTVTCGSLTFGGGGPSVGNPGDEAVTIAGAMARYTLSCSGPFDPACPISGNAGDIPNRINCTTVGCGGVAPIESTSPVKICTLNTLGASASGTLNLADGEISLNTTTNATVYILTTTSFPTTACPRCRTTTATTAPVVFASGGTTGLGVCDSDSKPDNDGNAIDDGEVGDLCFVFEPAGPTAGLGTDCKPNLGGGASAVISIGTTSTTAGNSVASATGNFCPAEGQGGNSQCTGVGTPQSCCTGAGMGSCSNFNGCFGSANAGGAKFADIPATCTGISSLGTATGLLAKGGPAPVATYGTVDCIPAVNSGSGLLDGLTNFNVGLPGPVVVSSKVTWTLE